MLHNSSFKLVGVVGKLNAGKDIVATALEARGYDRRAFADPLKLLVHELFGIPREVLWGPSENRTGEVRQMLQELGTEYARKFRPNVWVDKMGEAIGMSCRNASAGVVVPDVRFINEGEMLRNKGAILIRVVRPASGDHETARVNTHSSETESGKIPEGWIIHTIYNDGTLSELHSKVAAVIEEYSL